MFANVLEVAGNLHLQLRKLEYRISDVMSTLDICL